LDGWLSKDHRGVELISDVLSFGALCYDEPKPIGYAPGADPLPRTGSK
jgi:hypothetical protein